MPSWLELSTLVWVGDGFLSRSSLGNVGWWGRTTAFSVGLLPGRILRLATGLWKPRINVAKTFHGRDVFLPAALELASGGLERIHQAEDVGDISTHRDAKEIEER